MQLARRAVGPFRLRATTWALVGAGLALVWGLAVSGLGCSAVQRVPDDKPEAFLTFEVEPSSAEIYVDGEYKGTVDGWVEGAVPLEPGEHRVKVKADGFITRRFDVELDAGESKILQLEMEPELGGYAADTGTEGAPAKRPPSPLETESSLPGDRRPSNDSDASDE